MAIQQSNIEDGRITIKMDTRFNFDVVREFQDVVNNINKAGDPLHELDVDLSNTDYIDSSALGMLVILRKHMGTQGRRIRLTNCSDQVRTVLSSVNFQKIFELD